MRSAQLSGVVENCEVLREIGLLSPRPSREEEMVRNASKLATFLMPVLKPYPNS